MVSYGSVADMFGIDVAGLCDISAFDLNTNPYWTQISIPETLIIPSQKPSIEQINAVNVSANILKTKAIVTPRCPLDTSNKLIPNFEGRIVTGRKLIVEGQLCQTVSYTAGIPEQTVHSVHFVVPFSAYIVIPKYITIGTEQVDTLNVNFQINVCVEDVFIKEFRDRYIFKNVTLLLQAVPAPSAIQCPDE
ncbi:MAG: DUF3794 domain-containing protein [Clostridiales bacterium]|nr:DUF3794 domain-containing protein [Clostridiales bacterium]